MVPGVHGAGPSRRCAILSGCGASFPAVSAPDDAARPSTSSASRCARSPSWWSTWRPPAARRTTEAITEIGAVKVRGGEVLGEFATLVDPGRSIPPQITMLTGITDRDGLRRPAARRRAAVVPGVHPRLGAGRAQRPVRRRVPRGRVPAARAAVAAARPVRRHRAAGPRRADPRRGAQRAAVRAGPAVRRRDRARPPRADRRQGHRRRAARAVRAARSLGVHSLSELLDAGQRRRAHRPTRRSGASAPGRSPAVRARGVPVPRAARRGALRRHERQPAPAGALLLLRGRDAGSRIKRHGGAGRAGRHGRVRARAGGARARAAADRGPPAPYNRRSRAPHHAWWVTATDEAFPRLSVVRHRTGGCGRARSARGRRPSPPSRRCSTPCRCGPAPSASPAHGATGQPVRAARARALRRPVRRAADTDRVRARPSSPWPTCSTGRADDALLRLRTHGIDGLSPTASGSRRRPRRATGSPRWCSRWAGAQRLAALAAVDEIVGARPDGYGGWELAVIRYGRLAAAGVAARGVAPMPVVERCALGARRCCPGRGRCPAAPAEETSCCTAGSATGGTRLVHAERPWAEPARSARRGRRWAQRGPAGRPRPCPSPPTARGSRGARGSGMVAACDHRDRPGGRRGRPDPRGRAGDRRPPRGRPGLLLRGRRRSGRHRAGAPPTRRSPRSSPGASRRSPGCCAPSPTSRSARTPSSTPTTPSRSACLTWRPLTPPRRLAQSRAVGWATRGVRRLRRTPPAAWRAPPSAPARRARRPCPSRRPRA